MHCPINYLIISSAGFRYSARALPEMSRIVDSYGIGISTRERDPEKLAGIVRYMLKERAGGAWMEALEKAAL